MTDPSDRLVSLLADCRDDPDLFNSAILGGPDFFLHQAEWCSAIARYRRVVIVTGNAVGKDYFSGRVPLWWLGCRENSLVVVTGPSQTLLGTVIWKEIRRAVDGAIVPLGATVSQGTKSSPQTVDFGGGRKALGYSTTSVERASGQHAEHLLVIVEEASGLDREAWDAIDGLKPSKMLVITNPLRSDGGYIDLIRRAEADEREGVPDAERTVVLYMPSTESPHAHLDHSPCGMADRVWLEEQARMHGVDSLWYRSHVLAIVPTESHESLIPPAHLDRCVSNEMRMRAQAARRESPPRTRISCDVGEGVGAARSVVICADEYGILECDASPYKGPSETADTVSRMCDRHGVAARAVSYDGAGITGKRLGNSLASKGLADARPYFGGSSGGRRFTNFRTACAAALAARIDPEHREGAHRGAPRPFSIPAHADWARMREELLGLRMGLAGDKSQLEPKEDFADRLGRSPDYADAVTQLFRDEAIRG